MIVYIANDSYQRDEKGSILSMTGAVEDVTKPGIA